MDFLWSPWRFRYVSAAREPGDGCPFCGLIRQDPACDRESYVLLRARRNLVFLNLYPYTTGHLLVAPYVHVARLADLDEDTSVEMMLLARRAESALEAAYHAEGYNAGMNLGKCAGAGVADHLHLHLLPRWAGDTNFMSVIGETRVLPEDLLATYDKLALFFRS
ncbi:MAG: HIT family protein [Terriglobia bacterium]